MIICAVSVFIIYIFKYGEEGGDCDTVDIRPAGEGEAGPNTVPAPHPNLRKN